MGGLGREVTRMTQPPGPHKGEGEGPAGKELMTDDSLSTTKTAASWVHPEGPGPF